MEIKSFINSVAPKGEEVMFTRSWLGEYLKTHGFTKATFKPRLMPVYVRDDKNEYVLDAKGEKKVGYYSIKVEFTYCDPFSEGFENVFDSTTRVNGDTGEIADISPWAYGVVSRSNREKIMKYGVKNLMLRKGIYKADGEEPRIRYTWESLELGNGDTVTPVGKRAYHQWDENPDNPTGEPDAE